MNYSKYQPKDGDIILTCIHGGRKGRIWHWMGVGIENDQPKEFDFIRPDGTTAKSQFIVICDPCWKSAKRNMQFIMEHFGEIITQDLIWSGNEPIIKEIVQ